MLGLAYGYAKVSVKNFCTRRRSCYSCIAVRQKADILWIQALFVTFMFQFLDCPDCHLFEIVPQHFTALLSADQLFLTKASHLWNTLPDDVRSWNSVKKAAHRWTHWLWYSVLSFLWLAFFGKHTLCTLYVCVYVCVCNYTSCTLCSFLYNFVCSFTLYCFSSLLCPDKGQQMQISL